jgi:putative peptidoglycan lipid II flippase
MPPDIATEDPQPLPQENLSPVIDSQETAEIARSASVLALGNITSRVLGLVRETVKSHFFGAGSTIDAYNIATFVPTLLYDLLIGGMTNGALVPVFSAIAEKDRKELWRLASALINLTVLVLAACILILELVAPNVARLMLGSGPDPEVLSLATRLLRITVPAVIFLSLSGILSSLLYSLKRFTYPAFTAAIFNIGIVALALIFHRQMGVAAMAAGLLFGSILQVILQLPGLHNSGLRFRLNLFHSGLKRVAVLYAPSLVPLLFDVLISRSISYRLASQTGEGGISWMGYATYLTQLPQGLVATAISLAVLPTLSAHAAGEEGNGPGEQFKKTLAQGLRLVIVLIIPATVGLYILAQPVVALLYEHGDFMFYDTLMTTWALRFYLLGLPFAAIDVLLVFAFYARQDTITPSLIGVGTIVIYLLLAVGLLPTWGLFSLMIADSFKHLLHTLISGLILGNRMGGMRQHGVYRTLGLVIVAAALMGLAAFGALKGVEVLFPAGGGLAEVIAVGMPGLVGAGVYVGLVALFKIEEFQALWSALRKRLALRGLR